MESMFLKLLNLSITASWLVLAVLLVRLVFRKMPKWAMCVLWGIVALRLVCPISIKSILSLIPSSEPIPQEFIYAEVPQIQSGIPTINSVINPILSTSMAPTPGASVNPAQILSIVFSWVWFAGMILMLLYAFVSWFLLRRRVVTATLFRENIKQGEQVDSPFVLGFFRPTIYLPYRMNNDDMGYVIAHEQAHIQRKDHWWKPIGFLILSAYWFNPVLWIAYILLCRDIEAACDEKVICEMGQDDLRAYSTALMNCSVQRYRIAACPLAFGEVGVKERVKSVMIYKRPAFWIVILSIVACIVFAVCFLTNPERSLKPNFRLELEDIRENYSAEQAAVDGCIVIDNSTLLAGEKIWVDFVNQTAQGRQADVRIYQSYSDQGNDYWVKELRYDGEKYLLRFYDKTGDTGEEFLFQEEYKYLTRSIYAWNYSNSIPAEYNLLSDSEEATAQGYLGSLTSSTVRPVYDIYNHCHNIYSRTVDSEYAKQAEYGVAFSDIDGDGIEEKCYLGWGQTSGVFTFTLASYEDEKQDHYSVYRTEWYNPLRFVQAADGKLQIEGINQSNPPGTHTFDIVLRDGVIALMQGDTEIQPINQKKD